LSKKLGYCYQDVNTSISLTSLVDVNTFVSKLTRYASQVTAGIELQGLFRVHNALQAR